MLRQLQVILTARQLQPDKNHPSEDKIMSEKMKVYEENKAKLAANVGASLVGARNTISAQISGGQAQGTAPTTNYRCYFVNSQEDWPNLSRWILNAY